MTKLREAFKTPEERQRQQEHERSWVDSWVATAQQKKAYGTIEVIFEAGKPVRINWRESHLLPPLPENPVTPLQSG